MNGLFKKLGLTNQDPIVVINSTREYMELLEEYTGTVDNAIKGKYKFVQIFVKSLEEANSYAKKAVNCLEGDGHLWLCYPKGTSKKYKADINRDKAWGVFSPFSFEPVTLIAIDEDWSALRFRNVDYIKTMKRKTAATEKGKERIKKD